MTALTALWPYAHVSDVQRSIAFYAHLGLDVRATHEVSSELVWAFVTSSDDPDEAGAGLMLARADGPLDLHAQGVLFYCWTPDVQALRARLQDAGIDVGEITHPFYMPAGELRVADPDGYTLLVGQLSDSDRSLNRA